MQTIKYLIGLTFLFVTFTFNSYSHENHNQAFRQDWTMIASIQLDDFASGLKEISEHDIDIAGVDVNKKIVDVLIGDIDYKFLVAHGYDIRVNETKGITRKPDEEYKNPAEIEEILNHYSTTYSHLVKMVSIGKSLEGRDIWALKISDDPQLEELDEPSVLFNSMHHAREIMTPEVSIDIIDYLLTNYNSDSKVTNWVDSTEIWIIPMFNVDGNNKMWNHDSWWRKNTRGGYGVDLNRNYPAGWNSCNGSSGSQSSQTYRGPSPASEPETQAMMKFIAEKRPVFDISYHAYSELVIYPYGCGKRRTQTKEVVEKIGDHIAWLLDYEPGTAWELLYNADGGDIDWMYEAYQVIPYVIELNSRKQGFHPKYSKWRDKTVERNRDGWQYLLDRVQQSGIRGQVIGTDKKPLSDFIVKVFKQTDKGELEFQNYVGHKTGMFHIVTNPGKYKLQIITNKKVVKESLITVDDSLTRLSINL
jgi:hypothetical protein